VKGVATRSRPIRARGYSPPARPRWGIPGFPISPTVSQLGATRGYSERPTGHVLAAERSVRPRLDDGSALSVILGTHFLSGRSPPLLSQTLSVLTTHTEIQGLSNHLVATSTVLSKAWGRGPAAAD
jgi:hypothetical protein